MGFPTTSMTDEPEMSKDYNFLRMSTSFHAMDSVTRLVADKPVVIFSRSSCCMSYSIKTLICGFGANPTVYELDQIPNGQQIERALQQLGCKPTVPAVFIGQQLVGGAKEIMDLQLQNQLVTLLIRAGAIWV
ncbi:Glutaredoxin domain-containing protein [Cephalotus follicularis]|uniref:Glutaredoxin domain-containing protein n=1 Tax=Cephalotus follicularis TaxID=3775 RepID=A0A1Q3CSZ6_CEPFO|nr:Glutaredoxin domain-containing protein [Cephalotus follicularis]